MQWTYKLEQIREIATAFWKAVENATVFAFHGNMGAGKTTFIHALCDVKNVKSVVGSPTFSLINEYVFEEGGIEKKIYHIDLYRLSGEEETRQAGIEDTIYSGDICFIEWPGKIQSLLPADAVQVQIEVIDAKTHRITIAGK